MFYTLLFILSNSCCFSFFSWVWALFYKIFTCYSASYKQDDSSEERPEGRRWGFLRPMWGEHHIYLYLISAPKDGLNFSIPIVVHVMRGYQPFQILHQIFIQDEKYTPIIKGVFSSLLSPWQNARWIWSPALKKKKQEGMKEWLITFSLSYQFDHSFWNLSWKVEVEF
jgi:hypothetical protein